MRGTLLFLAPGGSVDGDAMTATAAMAAADENSDRPVDADGVRERDLWLLPASTASESPGEGRGLAATATLPADFAAPPVTDDASRLGVVLLHGWGGTRTGPHRMLVRLARALAGGGAVALRVDLSGRGFSDGDPEGVDLDRMIDDALRARDWLRTVGGCGAVSFAGVCSGGNVAVGAAATAAEREPAAAASTRLALFSTLPFTARDAGMARRKRWRLLGQYLRRVLRPGTWARLFRGEISGKGLTRTIRAAGAESSAERKLKDSRRDIPALWAAARIPALFIYGGGDPEAVPAWKHYGEFTRRRGIPAEAFWIDGANHNFYAVPWSERAEAAAVGFLLGEAEMQNRNA